MPADYKRSLVRIKLLKREGRLNLVFAGSRSNAWLFSLIVFLFICACSVQAQDLEIKTAYKHGDFKLAYQGETAEILASADDFKVVQIAARDLARDVERVTGKR